MCNFKVLEYNDTGYLMRCKGCGHLQLAFGNVALVLSENEFWDFKQLVLEHAEAAQYAGYSPDTKNIYMHSGCSKIRLVFSLNEIKNVANLVSEGALSLQVDTLLETQ